MPLYCGCTFGYAAQLHEHVCCGPFFINTSADLPVRTALQRHGRLARLPSRPVLVSVIAYNAVADSLSAPAYKRRDRLTRPHRFTMPRPVHP